MKKDMVECARCRAGGENGGTPGLRQLGVGRMIDLQYQMMEMHQYHFISLSTRHIDAAAEGPK